MTRYSKFVSAGALLALLAGCSSMNVGESEFSCSGMPGDWNGKSPACASATEVYEMTNNGEVPNPVTPVDRMKEEQQARLNGGSVEQEVAGQPAGVDPVTNDYVTPALPNRPVPIRTPAKVMRIWVAPWEDTSGNLNVPGYVYTEIEPRRWTVGEQVPTSNPTLRPLQVSEPASQQAKQQSRQGSPGQKSSLSQDQRPWLQ
ncbi:type IV conjugative transfer system lipoprotein TraV [Halomonas sp. I5-271120]|uniref:type IV conjugative transfer system lipoprotein TraV n=1 Tax=Halomonas sp. I5-271120 TaxID=3061632 RepID=UPI002715494A|nr:type IV conjugative transfer system lipoprotein TraV [Halomonas sp. I5-271120]